MPEQRYRMAMIDSVSIKIPKIQLPDIDQHARVKQSTQSSQSKIEIDVGLLKRFQTFLLNQKLIKLSTALKRHCGRHYPIGYRPEFGFNEYWQDQKAKLQESNILQFFQYPFWYYYIFAFAILLSKLGMIWTVSIHRLYQMEDENATPVLIWGIATLVGDILLQLQLFSHYDHLSEKDSNLLKYLQSFWKDLLLIIYFVTTHFYYNQYEHSLLLIDILVAVLLSKRCEQIKRSFRIQITSTSYKDAFNVVQLFSTLMPIAHIFALTLYYAVVCNTEKTGSTLMSQLILRLSNAMCIHYTSPIPPC